MGKILKISNALRSINLEREVLVIVEELKPQLIDLNTNQLLSGVDSNGALLKPFYRNANYALFKKSLNSKGVVDLFLTGDFHRGFFLQAQKFPLVFGSDDEKSSELETKYGKDIFGLNKNSLDAVKKEILPQLQDYIRKAIRV